MMKYRSLMKSLVKDMSNSDEITKEIYNSRSLTLKIKESVIRLLSPIL